MEAYWESDIDGVLVDIDTQADKMPVPSLAMNVCRRNMHSSYTLKIPREKLQRDGCHQCWPPNSAPLCDIRRKMVVLVLKGFVTFTGTTSDAMLPRLLSVVWSSDKDGELGLLCGLLWGYCLFLCWTGVVHTFASHR